VFADTLPCEQARYASISMSSIVLQLLQNLISQETAGYAIIRLICLLYADMFRHN
jgi:hypothetical protein